MATARKTASPQEKDPEGGLTAAGRKAFATRDGSHLKPGVTKSDAEMTPEDQKRKGSWAVRFYGRAALPPLVDAKGRPTRFALSAHAWGEPVPRTEAEARAIAEKGRQLLERYAGGNAAPAGRAATKKKGPVSAAATDGLVAHETTGKKTPAKKTTAKKATAAKTPADAPATKAPAEKAPARKAAAKKVTAAAPAKTLSLAGKAPAKKATARKAAARKATAKKAPVGAGKAPVRKASA